MKEEAIVLIKELWAEQRGAFICTVVGVLFAILVLLFGFWRVLFVLLCAGVGLLIGRRIDKSGGVWLEDKLHMDRGDFYRMK